LKTRRFKARFFQITVLVVLAVSFVSSSFVPNGKSSTASAYYYWFTVDKEGFTNVVINFNSTDAQGNSWVFVPKLSSWNYSVTSGQIVSPTVVDTSRVTNKPSVYFYQAFQFGYKSNGFFNMTLKYGFENGALIIEPRGIFYSPLIGFEPHSIGTAELFLYDSFTINSNLAVVIGSNKTYSAREARLNHALFSLQENIVRIQVEFSMKATPVYATLTGSDNKTFTFKTLTRYETYAQNILKFYDRIYGNFTSLFNVTLGGVVVQWFLPDFQNLLTVGGYVPIFTGGLGEINLNIVFIRGVPGTLEVIAAHELVHRFLGEAGLSPNDFLWFHEGMAQYISISIGLSFADTYDGAKQQKDSLENGTAELIQALHGENFGSISLQDWTPSYQPDVDIGTLYVAAYYVASRLPQVVKTEGFEYYSRFFKLIHNAQIVNKTQVYNINFLALFLSEAANSSVALTLRSYGFSLADLYKSPMLPLVEEAVSAINETNPIFQPYRFFAQYIYGQALLSAEEGDWARTKSLLQISIALANFAPLLTFLTILAILALLVLILHRLSKRPKPIAPQLPPLPPEILPPPA
jgi:hypothetical protein